MFAVGEGGLRVMSWQRLVEVMARVQAQNVGQSAVGQLETTRFSVIEIQC